jgi:hypothetical protein
LSGAREEKFRDDVAGREKSAGERDFDSSAAGAPRKSSSLPDAPADAPGSPPATQSSAPAAPAAQRSVDALKMESNIGRALADREQVNFIQCDVSPDFLSDNKIEKVLVSNGLAFERSEGPASAAEQSLAASDEDRKRLLDTQLRYSLQASPEQVEQIVNELEQEQGRKRVSNLTLGLQQAVANQRAGKRQNDKPAAASQAAQAQRQKQQALTIWLRQMDNVKMDNVKAAEPAKP